jgi:predicted dienelactone hydrolase
MLLFLACTPESEAPPWYPPDAVGPWPVATEAQEITSQQGIPLKLQLWFPASSPTDSFYRYDDLWESTAAFDGGKAACEQPLPVVLFSHGYSGIRWQSYFLTEYLASHGFLVVAPDHTYNTLLSLDEDKTGEVALRRPLDIADSYDAVLARSQDSADPLYGCIEEEAGYALIGHSFGGYTALATGGAVIDVAASVAWCSEHGGWLCDWSSGYAAEFGEDTIIDSTDSRITAILPMAPAGYEILVGGLPLIAVPTVIIGGSEDESVDWTTELRPLYDALSIPPRSLGQFMGAGHYTFSNACQIAPFFEGCDPSMSDAVAHPLINTLTTAWLRGLNGDSEAGAYFPGDMPEILWEHQP